MLPNKTYRQTYSFYAGKWMWLDGTPMDYVNWDPYELGDDSYGEIRCEDGTWRAEHSYYSRAYICETPKGKTMPQTTIIHTI